MTPDDSQPRTPDRCPQCAQPLTAVGKFLICPQHGPASVEKPFFPMRIFLSYGHDGNEELVRRIKADLEERGHDVWFDKSEIRFGDDWRREITDGIVGSSRVLSFLSKYSTRDPGVCLDELAIAIGVKGGNIQTVLVESEAEVKAPPSIGHIQWLDMHDWKNRLAASEAAWEDWYQGKLAEIVRVIESDESQRFAGEIETLNGYLKPISSDSRISALLRKGFVGRAWLFDAVDQWRNAPDRASRLFWVVGDPGVGKSAFAAHLTHFGRDKVVAAQFVEWDKPDHRSAQRVVRSLAFQLATRLPDYRKLLLTLPEVAELDRKDPAELFDYLLATPLRSVIDGGRERYLIVIDALDEAGEAGSNPLVELLARNAHRLPEWIGIVVTSRPESAVKTPLQGLNPFLLDTRTDANRADLRDYVRHELATQLRDRGDADRIVEKILEQSEGVFLYIERFCDDIWRGHFSLDRPEQFPQGLGGIFFQYFRRQFPDLENFRTNLRPVLRAVLAAREPLPLQILQRLFDWPDESLRDCTRTLGSLFPVTTESGTEVIKPYHKAITDWLRDEAKAGVYFVSILEGHRYLGNGFLNCWRNEKTALSEVVYHLAEAKAFEQCASLLFDEGFLQMKKATFGAKAVISDFLVSEEFGTGYFGLAGAAWHLFQFAENECKLMGRAGRQTAELPMSRYLSERIDLFRKACAISRRWMNGGHSVLKCSSFCRELLLLFVDDQSMVRKVERTLQDMAAGSGDNRELELLRTEVRNALAEARRAPRVRSGYGPGMVDSAWQELDYAESALSATLAALNVRPLQVLLDVWAARRFKAIADCDTDPYGAVGIALRDAEEALEAKMERSIQSALSVFE